MKRIWISWAYHRRSDFLAREFACAYFHFSRSGRSRLHRYAAGVLGTLRVLISERPGVVFAQNPSLVAVVFLVVLKPFFRYKLVNDLHTPYVKLRGIARSLFWAVQRFCIRHAEITIVTNAGFGATLDGGAIHVLPDRLPRCPDTAPRALEGEKNILYVCTFAPDEPYGAVVAAARGIPGEIHLYMTGDYGTAGINVDTVPRNLHLVGYVPDREYFTLLASVDIVMVLTDQEHCLVCGGYEGVAFGKPLILSDTRALREYFHAGAVYVDHSVDSIREGIVEAAGRLDELRGAVANLGEGLERDWQEKFTLVERAVRAM